MVTELKSVEMYQFIYFSAKEFFLRITNSEPAPNSTGDARTVLPDPCELWVIKHNLQLLPTYSKSGNKGKLCRRTQAHEIFLSLGHKVYVTSAPSLQNIFSFFPLGYSWPWWLWLFPSNTVWGVLYRHPCLFYPLAIFLASKTSQEQF